MRRFVVFLLCAGALMAACSDDQGSDRSDDVSTQRPETSEPIDAEAATERYRTVCERTLDAGDVESCLGVVDEAIDDAVEHGCSILALDAFVEHGVAWSFEAVPAAGFFEQCPLPLSNLLLPVGPSGYEPAAGGAGGARLLDTAEVADRYASPTEVAEWLAGIGHAVSYGSAWADGDDVVAARLDRFDTIEGATAYADFDALAEELGAEPSELTAVTGVLQGRVVSSPGAHIAIGRVCDIAINVHVQGDDATMLSVDEVVGFFSAQALRVQRVVACENEQ